MTDHSVTNWTRADDAMVEGAIRRGASRRELLRMFMAGGVALAAGGSILGRASAALAATPVMGGHLKAAGFTASTADTLDPGQGLERHRLHALLRLLQPPDLPQREQRSADGARRERRDHRRQGLDRQAEVRASTFHDGKTLSAEDVVFSLRRHLDEAVGSKVNSIAKQIVDIKAVDPLTVEITLAGPNADLPTILAHAPLHDRAGRHHRLLQGHRHRGVHARAVRARRAVDRRTQRELLQGPEGAVSTPSSTSRSSTRTPASTRCSRATCSSPRRSSRSPIRSSRACPASSSSGTPSATTPTSTCASTWRRATRPASSRASS